MSDIPFAEVAKLRAETPELWQVRLRFTQAIDSLDTEYAAGTALESVYSKSSN